MDSLAEAERSLADRTPESPVHSQASQAQSPAAAVHKGVAGLEVESQVEVVLQPGRAGSTDSAAGAAAGAAAAVVAQASPAEADGTEAQPCPAREPLAHGRVVPRLNTGPAVSVTGCTGRCYLQSQPSCHCSLKETEACFGCSCDRSPVSDVLTADLASTALRDMREE